MVSPPKQVEGFRRHARHHTGCRAAPGGAPPAGRLRRAGKVPAVVYGLDTDTVTVTVPARELRTSCQGESGANTLITLEVDGDDMLALVRQIQRHPTRGELVHVDFIRIRRDVAVSAEMPVHLVGEADGCARRRAARAARLQRSPSRRCRATSRSSLEVDVSALAIGDQLHVRDIPLPARRRHAARGRRARRAGRGTARRHRGRRGRRRRGRRGRGRRRREARPTRPRVATAAATASSRCCGAPRAGTPADLLVVGLGNPGEEYARHAPQRRCGDGRAARDAAWRVTLKKGRSAARVRTR